MEQKMLSISLRLMALILMYYTHFEAEAALTPGGLHVCARSVTYNTYYVQTLTRVGYDNYRTCCRRFLRACVDRCTRYRSKVVRYTKAQLRIRSKMQYYCCSGWAAQGNTCPLPICNPGCKNGKCVNPNSCRCNTGYVGKLCETDINECTTKKPCEQVCKNLPGTYACSCNKGYVKAVANNAQDGRCVDVNECATLRPCKCASNLGGCAATCTNTPGSFKCGCKFGFQLTFDQKTCVDIDECKVPSQNKCQQKCLNRPGSFSCACNAGFQLALDKRSCNDINECSHLNGGCNQVCNNKPGTFSCSCRPGYRLQSNKRTCLDIDECKENKPCDQSNGICRNLPGKYQCSCKTGYALQSDKKTCKDINECASKSTNGCTQKCSNAVGSYTCSCNPGFKLNANKRSCDDVNECQLNTHKCQHNCLNTVGSYKCSCKPGYLLHTDGKTCIAKPCQTLKPPINGKMTCTGSVTGSSCSFSCNEGYELEGSLQRTCQPNSLWSGTPASCKKRSCPELLPPRYGSVMFPCSALLGSKCLSKCNKGYFLNGTDSSKCIVEKGVMKWFPNDAKCTAATPCEPNPCQNGGQCKELLGNKFVCQCDGTNYKGETCEVGLISLPSFPQLYINEESASLSVTASPQDVLIIKPRYSKGNLKFNPDQLIIYPTTKEAKFTVTSNSIGVFPVNFDLIGIAASSFEKPDQILIYSYQKVDTKPVDIGKGFSKSNCKEKALKQCSGSLKLKSTCSWNVKNNGFVSIDNGKVNLPVSLVGLSQSDLQNFNSRGVLMPTERIKTFLSKRILTDVCDASQQCNGMNIDANTITTITNNNLFQREYFNSINKILPSWMLLRVDMKQKYFAAENVFSVLGDSKNVNAFDACKNIPLESSSYFSSYLPMSKVKLNLLTSSKSTSRLDKSVCVNADLCNNDVGVSFQENDYLNFDSDLSELGLDNVKIELQGFSVGGKHPKCVGEKCFDFNSAWKVSASMSFNSKQSNIGLDGFVYVALDEKTALQKLEVERNMIAVGSVEYTIPIRLLGGIQTFKGRSKDSKVFARVGGNDPSPACIDHGFTLTADSKSLHIDRSTTQVSFKVDKDLSFYFPHDVQGGKVTGIKTDTLNRISLQVRAMSRIVTMKVNEIKSALTIVKLTQELKSITKYADKFINSLKAFESTIEKGSSLDFITAFSQLDQLKEAANDFKIHLDGAQRRNSGNPRVFLGTKIVKAQLKVLDTVALSANDQTLTQKQGGQIVSYYGSFCIRNLCFDKSFVKIYDLSSDVLKHCNTRFAKYISPDNVVISIMPKEDLYLSPRNRILQGQEVLLKLSRTKNTINGVFESETEFESGFSKAKITINEKGASLEAFKVNLLSNEEFKVTAKSQIAGASWGSLLYKIQGVSSSMASKVLTTAQNIYQNISLTTEKRLKNSKDQKDLAQKSLDAEKTKLAELEKSVKESEKALLAIENLYRRHKTQQETNQTSFDSYLKTLDPLFIKKNVETVCTFQTCKETCLPLPVCIIKQDPLKIDVTTLKCVQSEQVIRRQVKKQFDTKCDVKQYLFIPYYTGSCKPNKDEQKLSDKKLQGSLIATGSAVGSLVGSVVPVIGTAIGAAVGAAVGWVASLFSSCDRSMEVYQKSWFEQKPCTLLVDGVEETKRPISKCNEEVNKVQTGFKAPYKDCKINECLAKVQDQICLQYNQKCEQKRQLFFKNTATIPTKFTDLYNKLSICNENVEASSVKVQTARKLVEFNKREAERVRNQVYSLEEEKKISDQKYSVATNLLKEKVCVMNNYNKQKDLSKLLKINNINFDTSLPFIENVLLKVDVTYQTKQVTIPFVYNVQNDKENKGLSINALSNKVINSVLCQSSRKRRSIDTKESKSNEDLTFEPWFVDEKQNASSAKLACVTLERTVEFLKSTIKKLNTKTDSANQLKMQLQYSAGKIGQALSNTFSVSTLGYADGNEIVKANQGLLMSANNQLNVVNKQVTPESVLDIWKNEAEIVTGFNDIKVCLNYRDCLDKAIDTLLELPTIFTVRREEFESKIFSLKDQIKDLSSQTNLIDLLSKSSKIEKSIDEIKSLSLHCADPPTVSLTQDKDEEIEEGSFITLRCDARSKLPIKYYWARNDKILDSESSATLTIKITKGNSGVYTCIAKNLVGEGVSAGKNIVAYGKPKFIEEPEDVVFVLPSDKESLISLKCNVTASPKANISWIYTYGNQVKILVGKNFPILELKSPTTEQSGYYHCVAQNKYGTIKSRSAKVDILPAILSHCKATISFSLVMTTGVSVSSFNKLTTAAQKELTGFVSTIQKNVKYFGGGVNITFDIYASVPNKMPSGYATSTYDNMLDLASKLRQAMASSFAVILKHIVDNKYKLFIEDKNKYGIVDTYTFKYDMKTDLCQVGHKIHSSGFLCVKCPKGTAGVGCKECPLDTYNDRLGQSQCRRCADDEFTEKTGSTSKEDCFKKRDRNTDIIFLIDTSTSFLRSVVDFNLVKNYVKGFMDGYKDSKNVRFALMEYYKYVNVLNDLNSYEDMSQFLTILDMIDKGTVSKDTSLALKEAKEMFKTQSDRFAKKVVITITNGFSKTVFSASHHGFAATRKAAVALQQSGVHMVCIGLGKQLDIDEMRAIASYPKLWNVFLLWKGQRPVERSLAIVDKFIAGTCIDSSINIGILVQPRNTNAVQLAKDKKAVTDLIIYIHRVLQKESFMLIPDKESSTSDGFFSYGEKYFRDKINQYYNSQNSYFDVVKRIEQVEYIDLTEKHRSWGNIKALMIVTENPIPKDVLKGFQKNIYNEEITIGNFVMNEAGTSQDDDNIYGFNEHSKFVDILETRAEKKLNC